MKKVILLPFKIIWYLVAWPAILGWKVGKFFLKNKVISTTTGGQENGDSGFIQLILAIASIVLIPLIIWASIPMSICHFRGQHSQLNFICHYLDERPAEADTEESEESECDQATTNTIPSDASSKAK